MTNWPDESDDDFPAPPIAGVPTTGPDDESRGTETAWEPAHGFPDQLNAVRVYCNEDGHLTRVRISLSWREKLGEDGLARAFGICFLAMNNYHRAPDDPQPPPLEPEPGQDRLSPAGMAAVDAEIARIDAELAALPPEPASHWAGSAASGSDFEDGVVVHLDVHGRAAAALFDPKWLATGPSSHELATGVLTAYRRARRDFLPPTAVYSRRSQLLRRRQQVTDRLLTMMANGLQSQGG